MLKNNSSALATLPAIVSVAVGMSPAVLWASSGVCVNGGASACIDWGTQNTGYSCYGTGGSHGQTTINWATAVTYSNATCTML